MGVGMFKQAKVGSSQIRFSKTLAAGKGKLWPLSVLGLVRVLPSAPLRGLHIHVFHFGNRRLSCASVFSLASFSYFLSQCLLATLPVSISANSRPPPPRPPSTLSGIPGLASTFESS